MSWQLDFVEADPHGKPMASCNSTPLHHDDRSTMDALTEEVLYLVGQATALAIEAEAH